MFLDDWQAWTLDQALGERVNGTWAAFECGVVVPRQNGKNSILEALELAALFIWGEQLIIHSAHKFDTAQEHFGRMQALIESNDDLDRQVKNIYTANGKEAIILKSGARLKFKARSRGGSRGFTGDRIVLDEAYDLPTQAMGAMLPALAAKSMSDGAGVQVWYTSSAPHPDSEVLQRVRRRASTGQGGRLFFAEWGNPLGTDPDDRDAWYRANPGLGVRISEEFITDELATLDPAEFARERLGVVTGEDGGSKVLPAALWESLKDPASTTTGGVKLALDVTPERAWSSLVIAGRRSDDRVHVEVIAREPGTGWLIESAKAAHRSLGVPVLVAKRSPAAGLIADLVAAGVPVDEVSDESYVRSCAGFQDAAMNNRVRHIDQEPLTAAVHGADIRPVGDSWAWSRKSSSVDITPLVGATLAHGALVDPTAPAPFFMVVGGSS